MYTSSTTGNKARSQSKKAVSTGPKAVEARAKKETSPAPPKPYKSRIETFLQNLDVGKKQGPILQDFEDMKPISSAGPQSVDYRQEYDQANKRIVRAFQSSQLIELVNLSGYEGKTPPTSRELVEILLDRVWKWPLPDQVAKTLREETEKLVTSIPIPTSLVLLLLVEDSHVFSRLEKEFDLNLLLDTSEGTTLQAEGVSVNLERLATYLSQRESELISASSQINTGDTLTRPLLQTAIKATKCHIETSENNEEVHFTAFNETAIRVAQRFIERLVAQSSREKNTLLIAQQSLGPSSSGDLGASYALYPFFPSKNIPTVLGSRKFFRLQKVSRSAENNASEPLEATTSLVDSSNRNFDLSQVVCDSVVANGAERSLTASLGHIVFSPPSKDITAPVPGSWPLGHGLKHLAVYPLHRHFIPSQPSPLLHQNPTTVSTVHRAVYYANSTPNSAAHGTTISRNNMFILEVLMRQEVSSPELDDFDDQDQKEIIAIVPSNGHTRCRFGSEQTIDVLLPDKYMDMRLLIRESNPVEEHAEPRVIKEYLADLSRFLNFQVDQQPTAPPSFEHEGLTYVLDTSLSVRQTTESVSRGVNEWSDSFNPYLQHIETVSETSLDLESKDKSMHCLIEEFVENPDDLHELMDRANAVAALPYAPNTEGSRSQIPVFTE